MKDEGMKDEAVVGLWSLAFGLWSLNFELCTWSFVLGFLLRS